MTHRGPFQPLLFCDSGILRLQMQVMAKISSCKFSVQDIATVGMK